MKTINHIFGIIKSIFSLSIYTILLSLFITDVVFGQYHPSSTSTSALKTGLSGVGRVNCDVRSLNNLPMQVVVWDGSAPKFHWDYDNGAQSGDVTLSTSAIGPDIAILYENSYSNLIVAVVYTLAGGTANFNSVVLEFYEFDATNHVFSLLSGRTQTYSCTSFYYANIDADARTFFAITWESNGDLHTATGKQTTLSGHAPIKMGPEWTLSLPTISGVSCDDVHMPDVAVYGRNSTTANNYIYYTYGRCGTTILAEQTHNFDDVLNGTSTPPIILNWNYQGTGSMTFAQPRIAANQYFTNGQTNHPDEQEFTIVAELHDVDGSTNPLSSIYTVTATNTGGVTGTTTYSSYNVTTDYYTGASTPQSDFFNIQSSTHYTTPENVNADDFNLFPVVAYDKNNDHIQICWNMNYVESAYATNFPIGYFPAHVYANPDYDKNNSASAPSQQPVVIGGYSGCEINSLDNSAANATSNGSSQVAVSCHNTEDMLYAWQTGGNLYWRNVTSGTQPKISNTELIKQPVFFPNPINPNSNQIHFNLSPTKIFRIMLINSVGQIIFNDLGLKSDLETKFAGHFRMIDAGLYQVQVFNSDHLIASDKVSVIK